MLYISDVIGTVYHLFKNNKKVKKYLFKCITCDNTITVQKSHFRTRLGYCRSCSKTIPYSAAFKLMQRAANQRNLPCELTLEDYKSFTKLPCYYCNDPINWKDRAKHQQGISSYMIDRKDNSLGYTKDNSVACCSRCNRAKHTSSEQEFIEMCRKVVNNWQK